MNYKITKRVGAVTVTLETDDRELAEAYIAGKYDAVAEVSPMGTYPEIKASDLDWRDIPPAPDERCVYKDTGE